LLGPPLLALAAMKMWYSAPLVVSVSLVYAATRHEHLGPILQHAVGFAIWIVVFMSIVFAIIFFLSRNL
jgi:hypothetical protein